MQITPGDILTLNVSNCTKYVDQRIWKVIGIELGGEDQEDVIVLKTVDRKEHGELRVPLDMIENMTGYKRALKHIGLNG